MIKTKMNINQKTVNSIKGSTELILIHNFTNSRFYKHTPLYKYTTTD